MRYRPVKKVRYSSWCLERGNFTISFPDIIYEYELEYLEENVRILMRTITKEAREKPNGKVRDENA